MKSRWLVLLSLLILIIIVGKMYENHRVQQLSWLIPDDRETFEYMHFSVGKQSPESGGIYQWSTEDEQVARELLEYLGDFKVKKINEGRYNEDLNQGERFKFEIHHTGRNPIIVHGEETGVHLLVGNYYEIVEGSIDPEWLRVYSDQHGGEA
ncbi:hypothetical protein [Halobacillus aidingensis]|uniref:Uncharacterized protein n=1 Tax=Halobacillus aidingensis TaxID=240303 RepID=A0A1H0LQ37_HALAD|nr:hypothetical protein [Halobacillus aidingensis]SDO70131.1 hypothetical protein SAMN05421677_10783 [Halobacillus aidingensis]